MADEALKCFTTLLESIPGWIADLEDILATAADRQKQLLFENQPPEDDEPPIDSCHSQPRKASKTSSVRSQHSAANRPDLPTAKDVEVSPPIQKQVPHMTQSDALRLAQRKRKTASAVSDLEGAPYKYRSRSMAVIYYDGETQKRFEGMVRRIGTCRNSLRKGKVSAFYVVMSGLDTLAGDGGGSDASSDLPKIAFRSTRSRRPQTAEKGDETQSFDRIDHCLERAQSMCERAAHQVLRDGDCAEELKQAKEHFAEARKLGEAESVVWERRSKEAVNKGERKTGDDYVVPGASRIETGATPVSSSEEKLITDKQSSSHGSEEVPATIEADTTDEENNQDITIDMMQLPRPYAKRRNLRSAVVPAG